MLILSHFLEKFLNLEKDNNTKISIILAVIKEKTSVELSKKDLEIKGDHIKINSNPVFRNEIFMHKLEIENSLKSQKIFLSIV